MEQRISFNKQTPLEIHARSLVRHIDAMDQIRINGGNEEDYNMHNRAAISIQEEMKIDFEPLENL